ncbi:polysaccharide biosynthesis/export family protein [Tenacibaculum sp. IB213877]|uniref:polysaccharide biosynthesis/export family protein n=1 Tax=Tenacibaculum sp. IB213877 TaxID=3097351 RepID=UPI002A5AF3CB|nr:polysaccharide biosynthesis/export family protein [Tenacibaculum sp. IB213877]MDY0781391.1 polysaccharide biosynthesis/export family protein [Tenacibaculum sp. IB213877]
MQNFKKIVILLTLVFAFSCVSKKEIVYFQNDEIEQNLVSNSYKTVLKPDDLLQITITALDLEAAKPFNLPAVSYLTTTDRATGTPQQQSYLVDNNGEIDFPVLGKIKIGGLTRTEAIEFLRKKLDPDYIKNPTINIRIANYKVTVLGDVNKPGTYTIPNERITILEAIGLAGDLKITGKRNNVFVMREVEGKKIKYEIDLRSNKIFTSPVYYLQQNDFVYIEPNKASSQDAAYNKNRAFYISVGSIILSLLTFLTR